MSADSTVARPKVRGASPLKCFFSALAARFPCAEVTPGTGSGGAADPSGAFVGELIPRINS